MTYVTLAAADNMFWLAYGPSMTFALVVQREDKWCLLL